MTEQEQIEQEQMEQIITMLDTFAMQGGGHMNVTVETESNLSCEVTKAFSADCDKSQTACSVVTLHQGIDD